MKKILKFLGCSRSRSKKLSSTNEEKTTEIPPDTHNKKIEKSFNSENESENNNNNENNKIKNLNSENELQKQDSIENISIDKKEIFNEINGFNINENIDLDELLISNDSPLICPYEKKTIKFTKRGLINLFDDLMKLEGWKNYWNKDNFIIDIRDKGSPINSEFYLIKTLYTIKKTELTYNNSIDNLLKFIYGKNIRIKWDTSLKSLELIDGEELKNYVIDTWAKSPIYLISERDGVEKRFVFKYNNIIYSFGTPVPDDYFAEKKNVVRIINYMNFLKLYEDNENFYFLNMNQADFKMAIPQFLINVTLPMTTKNWYNNLKKACNSYKIVGNEIEKIEKNNYDLIEHIEFVDNKNDKKRNVNDNFVKEEKVINSDKNNQNEGNDKINNEESKNNNLKDENNENKKENQNQKEEEIKEQNIKDNTNENKKDDNKKEEINDETNQNKNEEDKKEEEKNDNEFNFDNINLEKVEEEEVKKE